MAHHQKGLRLVGAALLLLLAVLRLLFHKELTPLMDTVFFGLVGGALALVVLPLERLASFKAAGFELSLTQPQIAGAIEGLGLNRIKSRELQAKLSELKEDLPIIRGSRVLWIDDHPDTILGERRVLRALGVEVTSVNSSLDAERTLQADNDFDLMISDIQRQGDTYKITGGVQVHEGLNLVKKLRTQREGEGDPVVKCMPVIFYAAYNRKLLEDLTRGVRDLHPGAEIANSIFELLPKVVSILAESRFRPIVAGVKKPTSPYLATESEHTAG